MKQTLLVVVASAAIGAAAALSFCDRAAPASRTQQLDVRVLQTAVERALESRGFGEKARAPQPLPAESPPQDAGASPSPDGAVESAASAAPAARRDGDPPLPPADRQAIESLRAFEEDETLRRAWLFRSERDVIAWLGTPDLVRAEDGGERWYYNKADGTFAAAACFARGRLIDLVK